MSLLYEASGLVCRYGRVTALDLPALGVDELRIHSGRVLTLVGYNGSGKSTLLRLLAFLEEPDEGRIIYHGGEDPRREVSLLLQEPYLLKTTVFENVVLGLKLRGRRDGLEEAYQAAMRQVGFGDPDAMRRRGPNALSGGERQRISIARAMLKNAPVVILDEATAYIDPENEALVQKAISTLTVGKTLIVIAHRLSTIVGADNIVVVKDGTIHAQGTHEKLLETCPLYRDMWQAHLGAKDQM